ncbi:MAG: transporter substrate-binding domain-containing protein [Limisphaerales bacterium]
MSGAAGLDFIKHSTKIEVPIFFRKDISGIVDLKSLRGFAVAAKQGDAAVDLLKAKGVNTVILFNNYESIIEAAKWRKINVFVADGPSALYFLNKLGIEDDFRRSEPINEGENSPRSQKGKCGFAGDGGKWLCRHFAGRIFRH